MDAICLISAPGTGTAQLGGMLQGFAELAAFGGVFSPEPDGDVVAPALWPALRHYTGINFAEMADRRLAALRRDDPGAWLDALEAASRETGKRLMCLRLWPDELPDDVVGSEVVPRIGMRFVLVMRRQLDAYVASHAARPADAGAAPAVELDIEDFAPWLERNGRWYRHWQNLLERRFLPCPILRYEVDIDTPPDRALRRFASVAALVGITLRAPAVADLVGQVPQSGRENMIDRVANWPAFARELSNRGLERRAFGYPI